MTRTLAYVDYNWELCNKQACFEGGCPNRLIISMQSHHGPPHPTPHPTHPTAPDVGQPCLRHPKLLLRTSTLRYQILGVPTAWRRCHRQDEGELGTRTQSWGLSPLGATWPWAGAARPSVTQSILQQLTSISVLSAMRAPLHTFSVCFKYAH